MIFFPDTHLFLHFRDSPELPWSDVTGDAEVTLIVGRTVQKELEKKKYELRGRAQDRARTYARKLADIVKAGVPLVLRENGPRVLLDFVPRPTGWTAPADLDPAWQDDQLVADALAYVQANPGIAVTILSGDAGVVANARGHGVGVATPGEKGWDLPPEATPEAKELAKLRRENEELRRTGAVISVELRPVGEEPLERIDLSATWHPPLSGTEIAAIVSEVRTAHTEARTFDLLAGGEQADPSTGDWDMPTDEAIESYRETHAKWTADLQAFVETAPRELAEATVSIDLEIWLRNIGTEPALRTRVLVETTGALSLSRLGDSSGEEDGADSCAAADRSPKLQPFRAPPSPPRPRRRRPTVMTVPSGSGALRRLGVSDLLGQRRTLLDALGTADAQLLRSEALRGLGSLDMFGRRALSDTLGTAMPFATPKIDLSLLPRMPPAHDPHGFYWKQPHGGRDGVTEWEFECDEYPHLEAPHVFQLRLTVPVTDEAAREGTVKVRVSARNLRKPFEATYDVRLTTATADTLAQVKSLLPL